MSLTKEQISNHLRNTDPLNEIPFRPKVNLVYCFACICRRVLYFCFAHCTSFSFQKLDAYTATYVTLTNSFDLLNNFTIDLCLQDLSSHTLNAYANEHSVIHKDKFMTNNSITFK